MAQFSTVIQMQMKTNFKKPKINEPNKINVHTQMLHAMCACRMEHLLIKLIWYFYFNKETLNTFVLFCDLPI